MINNEQLSRLIKQLVFSDIVANQADFATKLGYDPSTISGMASGKKPITKSFANKVSEIFAVNINWLRTGEGEMLKKNTESKESEDVVNTGRLIPFYEASAAAGVDVIVGVDPTYPSGMIEIGSVLRDSDAALRVYGNSMTPNYPPGCIIAVKLHIDTFIEPGRVYVIETRDNRYLKRLYYSDNREAFHCLSDNVMKYDDGPRKGKLYYQDFEIPINEVIRIHRVVGVIKRNQM